MADTKTMKELRVAYRVTHKTMRRWLDRIPFFKTWYALNKGTTKRVFAPAEVDIIYQYYGKPDGIT